MRESWQRDDTSVQRRVADLKAAGLNPVLAANGAGEPNSGPISIKPVQGSNIDLTRAYASAMQDRVMARTGADAQVAVNNAKASESEWVARAKEADVRERFAKGLLPYQDSLAKTEAERIAMNQKKATSEFYASIAAADEAKARASIAMHDAAVLEKYPDMLSTSSSLAKDVMGGLGMVGSFLDKVSKYNFVPAQSK